MAQDYCTSRGAYPVSVRQLCDGSEKRLGLSDVAGESGYDNRLQHIKIQHYHGVQRGSLQARVALVVRPNGPNQAVLQDRISSPSIFREFQAAEIPCIFLSEATSIAPGLRGASEKSGIPVMASAFDAMLLESRVLGLLRESITGCIRVHGVLLEMFGLGVLLQGDSGAGKTTAGLMLVSRGHKWVADDIVEIEKVGRHRLFARGVFPTRHWIDLRKAGLVNACELFDRCQLTEKTALDVIVRIIRTKDALSIKGKSRLTGLDLMGIGVPCIGITMAGRSTRDVLEIESQIEAYKRGGGRS